MSQPERILLNWDDSAAWNDAIATLPDGDASHDWRWGEVLEAVYGWKAHRVLWRRDGHWIGAVQFHVYPHRLKRVGISSPFLTTGGLLLADVTDGSALRADLGQIANQLSLTRIDLREIGSPGTDHGEFTFYLPLMPREKLLASFESKLRSQVRKPQKESYTAALVEGSEIAFYPHFQRKMHEFGTPVHHRRLFNEWLTRMPDVCRQFTVRDPQGQIVGGMLMTIARGRASIPFAVIHEPERRSAANMLLYWEAMAHACDAGCTVLDFGRSQKDSGTYKFKLQWGSTPMPLVNRQCSTHSIAEVGFGIRGGFADRCTNAWSHLPGWIADRLGPCVRRFIP